jgi:DnaD/phage-associated family protein
MMASISWWRSWHGAPTDLKWQVVALKANVKVGIVSAVAWALLDYASQHENRGTVDGFDTETYAVYSGFDEVEIISVIQAMTDKGVIVDGRLASWEKRQPKREDDSKQRVTKHREMKRNVTQCNADTTSETISSVSVSVSDSSLEEKYSEIYKAYEDNAGTLSPMIAQALDADIEEFTPGWVMEAIEIATRQEKRSLSYVEGILKSWKRNGKNTDTRSNGNGHSTATINADGTIG